MTEGELPINPGDLPTDVPILEASGIYRVTLERGKIANKLNSSGRIFCQLGFTVADGDFEGYPLQMNHLALPIYVSESAPKKLQIQAKLVSAPFGRFCACFKITTPMPQVTSLADRDAIQQWQDWFDRHIGAISTPGVTIQNQEFPEGSGRMRSAVNDFLF